MVGSIFGYDKHKVEMTVNVLIHLNRDSLSHSVVEVNRVTITEDKQVEGLTPTQQIQLLKVVAPMLGLLVP